MSSASAAESPAAALADEYWSLHHEHDQIKALWDGDLDHVERWPDFTADATDDYHARLLDVAGRAEALQPAVDGSEAMTLATVASHARSAAATLETRPELEVHNPVIGMLSLMEAFLPRYTLRTEAHGRSYLDKLRATPAMVDGMIGALERGRDRGWVPIELHVRDMIGVLDRIRSTDPGDDPMCAQPAPSEWTSDGWRDAVTAAVMEHVRPSLVRYREALATTTLPVARPDDRPGVCHVPGGEDVYRRRLAGYTTTTLTPEQIHATGLEQVARLDDEYRAMGASVFGTDDLPAIYERLRGDASLHYHDVDRLLADATEMLRRAQAEAPRWFRTVPASDCEVRPTKAGALAFYSGPDLETGKPAAFYFNVADPTLWGPQLASTTFHEGVPGHHFDMARSIENPDLHLVQQKLYIAAFNEGWALYSERLSDEMGLFRNDVERLGMLAADSLRACRLVVDTGMHALGWSRDRAIAFMLDNSPLPRAEVVAEIDRYIGDPGQATGYMIGRLSILEARTTAERRLGSRFGIADFHEAVLGHGTVPLEAMRASVDRWVDSTLTSA